MGKCMVVVGGTGVGKSTFIKNFIKSHLKDPRFKHLINDINNEYKSFTTFSKSGELQPFLEHVQKIQNTMVVFEEATIYFGNNTRNAMLTRLLTLKRHSNNFYILVFHSLNDMAKNVKTHIDLLVLFKTNDLFSDVKKKLGDRWIPAYAQMKKHPDKHHCKIYDFRKL